MHIEGAILQARGQVFFPQNINFNRGSFYGMVFQVDILVSIILIVASYKCLLL